MLPGAGLLLHFQCIEVTQWGIAQQPDAICTAAWKTHRLHCVLLPAHAGDSRSLLPAVFQQLQLTCQVLELAVRAEVHGEGTAAHHAAFTDDILQTGLGLCGEHSDAATAAAAAAATQHAQQLFALAVSCLKLAAAQPSTALPPSTGCNAQQTAAAAAVRQACVTTDAVDVGLQLMRLALAPIQQVGDATPVAVNSTGCSSSSRAASSAPADLGRLGLVLTARGMLLEAALVQSAGGYEVVMQEAAAMYAAMAPAASASGAATTSSSGSLDVVVQFDLEGSQAWSQGVSCFLQQPAIELPGAAGSEQTCAAAKQQLLQLQGRMQKELNAALELLNGATNSSSSGSSLPARALSAADVTDGTSVEHSRLQLLVAAAASIMQHRKALAEALCAQFPLTCCCNNPGCTELRGASELQLVGGKGCVCARCRLV
jgi:hypothetical protein